MKLRIGDKVRFLNETGEGVVSRIKDKLSVFVEMPDGFEIPYLAAQLVPIHTELIIDKDQIKIKDSLTLKDIDPNEDVLEQTPFHKPDFSHLLNNKKII